MISVATDQYSDIYIHTSNTKLNIALENLTVKQKWTSYFSFNENPLTLHPLRAFNPAQ